MQRMTDVTASDLTLEEKASLTSGKDFWTLKAVDRVGIPSVMVTDGPHGLRKQAGASDHLGLANSVPATCFPPAVGLGASWDETLAERVGEALGVESAIEDVAVILGPGINIKRSPLCGRNFEYFSEDPIVSGVMGSGLVRGIQSKGVGSSLKHFAANQQETDRVRSSSDIDPRPLREIYLRGFERVVKDTQPWTVMCSYNRLNGVWTSEDPWLLNTVLRDEWGFEGLVVSDWGAVHERVLGVAAGLDLEMPGSSGRTDAELVAAVRVGTLDESVLDVAAQRVLDLVQRSQRRPAIEGPLDVEAHHALAREAAGRAIVLLRNAPVAGRENGLLPLSPDAGVAVIGEFARTPRYQGAGSSQINPTRIDTGLDAIRQAAAGEVSFAAGFTLDGSGDAAALRAEAVAAASSADVAVIFAGVPAEEESEGFDRAHMNLPATQLEVIDAVLAVNPNTVVVLSNGGAVLLPFADSVPAILEGWLLGQAGGSATADVLYGAVNPSGKLAETLPLRLEDNSAYGSYPGELGHTRYGEGVLVGYRWYDEKALDVAFPFGHGLSYTTFSYGDAAAAVNGDGDVVVTVPVTNTGDVFGHEVVQVYTSFDGEPIVHRAPRELKGFAVLALQPGETATAEITLRRSELTYWDIRIDGWVLEGGTYGVHVGASSRDIRSTTAIALEGDTVRLAITLDSSIEEVLGDPVAGPPLREAMYAQYGQEMTDGMIRLVGNFPVGRLDGFPMKRADMVHFVDLANGRA
jgi:beta-glucosidase